MSGKYIRKTDAECITNRTKAALRALADECARAAAERITPDMKAAEIEVIMEAEIKQMLRGVDQIEAEVFDQIDAAATDGRDGSNGELK